MSYHSAIYILFFLITKMCCPSGLTIFFLLTTVEFLLFFKHDPIFSEAQKQLNKLA